MKDELVKFYDESTWKHLEIDLVMQGDGVKLKRF